MSFVKKYLAAATITLLYMAASFHGMVVWHEHSHKDIYEKYGCQNITIEYNYLKPGEDALAVTKGYCIQSEQMAKENDKIHQMQNYAYIAWFLSSLAFAHIVTSRIY